MEVVSWFVNMRLTMPCNVLDSLAYVSDDALPYVYQRLTHEIGMCKNNIRDYEKVYKAFYQGPMNFKTRDFYNSLNLYITLAERKMKIYDVEGAVWCMSQIKKLTGDNANINPSIW